MGSISTSSVLSSRLNPWREDYICWMVWWHVTIRFPYLMTPLKCSDIKKNPIHTFDLKKEEVIEENKKSHWNLCHRHFNGYVDWGAWREKCDLKHLWWVSFSFPKLGTSCHGPVCVCVRACVRALTAGIFLCTVTIEANISRYKLIARCGITGT